MAAPDFPPRVRMGMEADAEGLLASWLLGDRGEAGRRVMDQLWLRTVLVEQRRRVGTSERVKFTRRADECLALLDYVCAHGSAHSGGGRNPVEAGGQQDGGRDHSPARAPGTTSPTPDYLDRQAAA
jgi:hypothetical protein